jgi:hypothetical protein
MSTPLGVLRQCKNSPNLQVVALRQCKSGQTIFVWSCANIIVPNQLLCQVKIPDPKPQQAGTGRPKFFTI